MTEAPNNLLNRLARFVPVQFKTMDILIWPIGQKGYKPVDPGCPLEDLSVHICRDRDEIETLCAEKDWKISDTDWLHGHFEDKLCQCQTAVLAFSQRTLAHVFWIVAGREAIERLFWDPPVAVDWENSALSTGVYTPPRFRGKNLQAHVKFVALEYLHSLGIQNVYGAVHLGNVASVRGVKKSNVLWAAKCSRVRLGYHRYGVAYIAMLTWGYRPNSSSRWFRRQFSDSIPLQPLPFE